MVDVFDDVAARWALGPREPNPPEYPALERSAANWKRYFARFALRPLPRLHVDITQSLDLDAIAAVQERCGLVGISVGTIFILLDLFVRMMSHPHVLVAIGNAAGEDLQPEHSEPVGTRGEEVFTSRVARGDTMAVPRDEARHHAALLMVRAVLDFIVAHELTHICHGHCEYLKHASNLPFMLELMGKDLATDPLTIQTLERDADASAASRSLMSFMEMDSQKAEQDSLRQYLSEPRGRLFLWCFAIASFFYLFGLKVELEKAAASRHPQPGTRYFMAFGTVGSTVENLWPDLLRDLPKTLGYALHEMYNAFSLIGIPTIGGDHAEVSASFEDPEHTKYVQSLYDRWHLIMPDVQKFSYSQLR